MCVRCQDVQPPNGSIEKGSLGVADSVPEERSRLIIQEIRGDRRCAHMLRLPYAGEPMGDESERRHQQQQHSGTILRVPVDLPGNSH